MKAIISTIRAVAQNENWNADDMTLKLCDYAEAAEARATELAAQLATAQSALEQAKQEFQSDRLASAFTNQLVFSTLAETCEKLEAAEANAAQLAAQLNQVNAYLQSAIEERNRAEFELSSARNALRDIANGKYADPKNFAAAWINAHSFEPDVQT